MFALAIFSKVIAPDGSALPRRSTYERHTDESLGCGGSIVCLELFPSDHMKGKRVKVKNYNNLYLAAGSVSNADRRYVLARRYFGDLGYS